MDSRRKVFMAQVLGLRSDSVWSLGIFPGRVRGTRRKAAGDLQMIKRPAQNCVEALRFRSMIP